MVYILPTTQTTLNVNSGDISSNPGGTHSFTVTDTTTYKLKISDDDATFADGWGDATQQIAPASAVGTAGDLVGSREYWTLSGSDGSTINLYVIMIPSQFWDPAKIYNTSTDLFFETDQPLLSSVTYTITSFNTNGAHAYHDDELICFLGGTLIETARGPRPIEQIGPDELVVTRDNGLQKVLWSGRRDVIGMGSQAPVRIAAGVLGAARDVLVTQNHRLLLDDWRSDYFFGCSESLIQAKHMVGQPGISLAPRARMSVHHLLFERHEVVFADQCATESLFMGQMSLRSFARSALEEVAAYFPELISDRRQPVPARPCVRPREARVLMAVA